MGHTYSINDLKQMSTLEQVMAYLHRNNIPVSANSISLHLDQIKSELGLSELPPDVSEYVDKQEWEYRESDIMSNYLKNSRMDVFLHPRFAPVSVHSHNYFEIKYLLSGSANILIAGHAVSLGAGDMVFIAPKAEHVVNIYDSESLLINIVITLDAVNSAFPRVYFSNNPLSGFFSSFQNRPGRPFLLCRTGADETIQNLILTIYHKRACSASVPFYVLCESVTEHLLLEVLASHSGDFELDETLSSFPKKLFPILGYIHDHCATINLTKLSEVFNYSTAHLSRIIKQYTGESFSSLLRSARLNQASILLSTSDIPIQDIMLQTGYTGKAHFYRVFQDAFGMTPAQFRKQNASSRK